MSDRRNINDVAIAAGVSRATVSQVLRGAGRISDDTRQRVLTAIDEIGYVYNRAAANLRAGKSTTLGIAVSELSNPFFAELASGATRVLEEEGYFSTIVDTEDDVPRQGRFMTMLREHMIAGALICPAPGTTEALAREWQTNAPPMVGLLRRRLVDYFDFVGVDNRAGMYEATRHLIELGHRQIGFVGGRKGSESREERLAGWRAALTAAGIQPNDVWVEPTEATIAAGSRAIEKLLSRAEGITGIVCHQDIVAFGVTIGLRKRGLVPGAQVSVVGFDDIATARVWDPPLTTMSVTPAAVGAEAARMLLRRIEDRDAPLKSIVLRPRLMVRASTGALSQRPD